MSILIDEKWADGNGKPHQRYTVRCAQPGYFMPVDVLLGVVPLANGDHIFRSREAVWDWLRTTDTSEIVAKV